MRFVLPVAVSLAVVATAPSQSFQYVDFLNVSSLSLIGSATQFGAAVRLTDNVVNQTGWMYHGTLQPVVAGFDTSFTFRITGPVGASTTANGMAFVLHDAQGGAAAQGGSGFGLGYGSGANLLPGLPRSIAIELDTFQDGILSDTSSNELSIHTNGALGNREHEQFSLGRVTPATLLSDGQLHTLRVRYVPGTLDVFVDGAAAPTLSVAYDFELGGTYANGGVAPGLGLRQGGAWCGFSASTGANQPLTERVELRSWTWSSTALVDDCYLGTLGEDVLQVEGQTGGLRRTLQLPTHAPFAIGIQAPTAVGPGAPWVLVGSLQPTPGAPGTSLGFGNACMPMLPFGLFEVILADSGNLAGAVPGGPAPFALQLPAGTVPFALDVTLQAVVLANPSPFQLGLSNAIDLEFRPSPAPTITRIFPLSATPGSAILVSGSGFLPGVVVDVNGVPLPFLASTSGNLQFGYPAGLPCGSVLTVTNPDGQTVSAAINPVPVVTNTVLNTGPAAGNRSFAVTGSGFAPGTTVTIGGNPATVVGVSINALAILTPPGTPGTAQVVITTPGGCQTTTTYTYL